jgi:peptidoglycan/xylan/chitin deacetylase (PgdA/CDA1 family)
MFQVPDCLRHFFGNDLLWRVKTASKTVYLTFDDGPVPEATPGVLSILKHYNCKATFFCVAENVEKHNELYQQLLLEGHRTGNHTYNHLKAFSTNDVDYLANVKKASKWVDSRLFRPPHGQLTPGLVKRLKDNYTIVMWDLITYDYDASVEADRILKLIRKKTRPGTVVVFHDSVKARENVLKVLPKALEYWKEQGYNFGLL